MKYKNFPEWYDPEDMIEKLSSREKYLLETFERLQDPKLIRKYQNFLSRIAFEKARIIQSVQDYT